MTVFKKHSGLKKQQGATFIIVLAILSMLFLMAMTLTYTSKLDVLANSEFAREKQIQIGNLSAPPIAERTLSAYNGPVSRTQLWYMVGKVANEPVEEEVKKPIKPLRAEYVRPIRLEEKGDSSAIGPLKKSEIQISNTQQGKSPYRYPIPVASSAKAAEFKEMLISAPFEIVRFEDTNSLFNLNILGSWEESNPKRKGNAIYRIADIRLMDAIEISLRAANIEQAGLSERLAREIMEYRYGKDNAPGTANYDDNGDGFGNQENLLSNQNDDDNDHRIDNKEEALASILNDGLDQNLDGYPDDSTESIETDGIDNDGDGEVDERGEGTDDPREFNPDPRRPANGDDRSFAALEELYNLPSMDDEIFQAMKKYFTVFSASRQFVKTHDGQAPQEIKPLNINYATADEILDAIKRMQPDKDEELLYQYVVNLVDQRDPDSIPTKIDNPKDLQHPYLGCEMTPIINEVHADSVTPSENGDKGEFIEIWNPWPKPLSVNGWQLHTGSGGYRLSGTIAPEGFLIITDNYEESDDIIKDDDENSGSFYDIFGLVPGGNSKLMVEVPTFSIPDAAGTIKLSDSLGNLIDYVSYTNGISEGVTKSLQRGDPRVRFLVKQAASPFAKNMGFDVPEEQLALDVFGADPMRDRPYTSPADSLLISSGYVKNIGLPMEWNYPTIGNVGPEKIDSRVVDLFTMEVFAKSKIKKNETGEITVQTSNDNQITIDASKEAIDRLHKTREDQIVYGRLNINTCSEESLLAIPDMTREHARKIIEYREVCEKETTKMRSQDNYDEVIIPFSQVGDLLRLKELWGDEPELSRIERFASWQPVLTTNSKSFEIIYGPLQRAEEKLQARHPARYRAVLALDGKGPRIIRWHKTSREL